MKKFFAALVLICFSVLSLSEHVFSAERPSRPQTNRPAPRPQPGRPAPPQRPRPRPDRPAPPQRPRPQPDRPVPPQRPRPQPDRPVPPQRPRPQPDRPVPHRPLPPLYRRYPHRPLPPWYRPRFPYPTRYPHRYYGNWSFWGLLWGIPMIARGVDRAQNDLGIDINNYEDVNYNNRSESETRFKLSSEMEKKALDVEKLVQELRDEMERENVDKLKAMRIYSDIKNESLEISDWSFSEYMRIADGMPPGWELNEPIEIPEDTPPDIKAKMKPMQEVERELRIQLYKRPVDKIRALELYQNVRNQGIEIADEKFYKYLDSIN